MGLGSGGILSVFRWSSYLCSDGVGSCERDYKAIKWSSVVLHVN